MNKIVKVRLVKPSVNFLTTFKHLLTFPFIMRHTFSLFPSSHLLLLTTRSRTPGGLLTCCNQPPSVAACQSTDVNKIMMKCFLLATICPCTSGQRTEFPESHFCEKLQGQSSPCSGSGGEEWKGGYCISIYTAFQVRAQRWKVAPGQRSQGEILSQIAEPVVLI